VLELRRLHPFWGQRTIAHRLAKEGYSPAPSESGVYRSLVRHGLIEPKARRKRLVDYKRWERGRPMELWRVGRAHEKGHLTQRLRRLRGGLGAPRRARRDLDRRSRRPGNALEVLFDKICRENGITHRLTAPTTTGKIERFHRSLRTEFLRGKVFSDLAPAQGELDR
jgi:transposase InsO family protein